MIRLENVTKIYPSERGDVEALAGVTLEIPRGQLVAVTGPSGCGKTTLLMTLGAMLHPTSGRVEVAGTDVYALNGAERARFRAGNIGFVFQMFHLVPYLDVIQNVLLGPRLNGDDRGRAAELLERLGLSHRLHHKPSELSAGEKQRAAIARAMLKRPELILADEPTGNLDPDNATQVFEILGDYRRDGGTVIVVTHGDAAEAYAQRRLRMRDGRVVEDTPSGEHATTGEAPA